MFKTTQKIQKDLRRRSAASGSGAALVPDLPRHDAGDPVRDLVPGNLAFMSPGGIPMTLVLEGRVDPLLDQPRELLAEGEGHHDPCQILR